MYVLLILIWLAKDTQIIDQYYCQCYYLMLGCHRLTYHNWPSQMIPSQSFLIVGIFFFFFGHYCLCNDRTVRDGGTVREKERGYWYAAKSHGLLVGFEPIAPGDKAYMVLPPLPGHPPECFLSMMSKIFASLLLSVYGAAGISIRTAGNSTLLPGRVTATSLLHLQQAATYVAINQSF